MATMNISLPETMKEYVEERISEGGFSTASEYFRDLVREDQRRQNQQKIESLLLEGLESGPATPITSEDWADIRREVQSRLTAKRPSE